MIYLDATQLCPRQNLLDLGMLYHMKKTDSSLYEFFKLSNIMYKYFDNKTHILYNYD